MSQELNIPNEYPKSGQQSITLRDQVLKQNNPPKLSIDPAAPIKAANPQMILNAFGLSFLQTEIYRGRIPIANPDESPIGRRSRLGTSIFSDLQFVETGGTPHIPVDTVLYDVHLPKFIVRTPVQGRDGQVKQFVGEDDIDITIRGVICGENRVYPLDHVKNLIRYARTKQSLGIISRYLNEVWEVDEIVIYDIKFEMSEGSQSFQKFELMCWSDKPVEILIKESK